jgi:hypothetical protein
VKIPTRKQTSLLGQIHVVETTMHGDQIGRIFQYWASVSFLGATFSTLKVEFSY